MGAPVLVMALAIALAGGSSGRVWGQKMPTIEPTHGVRVGSLAHDFSLDDLDGRNYRLDQLIGKQHIEESTITAGDIRVGWHQRSNVAVEMIDRRHARIQRILHTDRGRYMAGERHAELTGSTRDSIVDFRCEPFVHFY